MKRLMLLCIAIVLVLACTGCGENAPTAPDHHGEFAAPDLSSWMLGSDADVVLIDPPTDPPPTPDSTTTKPTTIGRLKQQYLEDN